MQKISRGVISTPYLPFKLSLSSLMLHNKYSNPRLCWKSVAKSICNVNPLIELCIFIRHISCTNAIVPMCALFKFMKCSWDKKKKHAIFGLFDYQLIFFKNVIYSAYMQKIFFLRNSIRWPIITPTYMLWRRPLMRIRAQALDMPFTAALYKINYALPHSKGLYTKNVLLAMNVRCMSIQM